MQPETSLQTRLYDIFSQYYCERAARRLARSHVLAHEQFQIMLGLVRDGFAHKKYKVKRLPRARPLEEIPLQLSDMINPGTHVSSESIEREILSFMISVDARKRPVKMTEVVEALAAFNWGYARIHRAMTNLCKKKVAQRDGNYRKAKYFLLFDPDVPSRIEPEGLKADSPAEHKANER